jgi:uncharacterized protein
MGARPAEDAVYGAVVALGRALRDAGIATTLDSELALVRALAEVDIRSGVEVYWAARACLVHDPGQIETFDRLFERFWEGRELSPPDRGAEHGEADPRMTGPQHGGEALPQLRPQGRSWALVDGNPSRASREVSAGGSELGGAERRRGLLAAYSPAESLTERKPLGYGPEELAAVRRLAEELRDAAPERRSRRQRPSRRRGRVDLRHTLRRSLRTEGEPLRPAYIAPSLRPRRLLFLCDVSGSMDRYSRVLLASLRAATGASPKTEAFVFATRLTRLTKALSEGEARRALEGAREAVADWSGGTRIGEVLADFNRSWGRRGLARGAIVIVISDGWDRGDPERLARELARLRLQTRRLVWVNPRPAAIEDQPLAIGMRAALPHLDDFVAGHDPRAVAGLSRIVAGLDSGRPARPQRPVDSIGIG